MSSPALQAALDRIARAFANPNGRAKRMAKTMLGLGAHIRPHAPATVTGRAASRTAGSTLRAR